MNYKKSLPEIGFQHPHEDRYEKVPPNGGLIKPKQQESKKPAFVPPRKREITEFTRCPKDCFINLFGCDTKANYCSSNCTCDKVCHDTACSRDCVPNCKCDSYCSDCGDYCGRDCDDFCRLDV